MASTAHWVAHALQLMTLPVCRELGLGEDQVLRLRFPNVTLHTFDPDMGSHELERWEPRIASECEQPSVPLRRWSGG